MNTGIGKIINLEKWGLTSFKLKMIALFCMTCDHIGYVLCHKGLMQDVFRGVGRLSFPLFAFLLAEGFYYTSNRLKYAIRLGVFAIISEVPFDYMRFKSFFYMGKQNIFFSLFIGFVAIWLIDRIRKYEVYYPKKLLDRYGLQNMNIIAELIVMIVSFGVAWVMRCDYSYAGIILIIAFYAFRGMPLLTLVANLFFNMGLFGWLNLQWWGALSAIPIAFYNGKPGCKKLKYFFYIYYPLHMLVIVLLRVVWNIHF